MTKGEWQVNRKNSRRLEDVAPPGLACRRSELGLDDLYFSRNWTYLRLDVEKTQNNSLDLAIASDKD